jgi:hypothetical protein
MASTTAIAVRQQALQTQLTSSNAHQLLTIFLIHDGFITLDSARNESPLAGLNDAVASCVSWIFTAGPIRSCNGASSELKPEDENCSYVDILVRISALDITSSLRRCRMDYLQFRGENVEWRRCYVGENIYQSKTRNTLWRSRGCVALLGTSIPLNETRP